MAAGVLTFSGVSTMFPRATGILFLQHADGSTGGYGHTMGSLAEGPGVSRFKGSLFFSTSVLA